MKIIDIKPRVYCKGVVRAIILAKKTRQEYPYETISILGSLVHNKYIVAALEKKGIKTINTPFKSRLELLDEVEAGIVIFSAHGVSTEVKQAAQEKGLMYLDATCEDVQSTHDLIKEAKEKESEVIYIGKKNHPESLAVVESFDNIHFVTSIDEINQLQIDLDKPLIVTNQTTLSTMEIANILNKKSEKYPHAEIINEICLATRVRQEAIIKQQDLDALIVVGDPTSNNTAMLARIGKDQNIQNIFRIETLHDLDLRLFKRHWTVGITSGASTPNYLTNMVVDYMKDLNIDNPSPYPEIDFERILD